MIQANLNASAAISARGAPELELARQLFGNEFEVWQKTSRWHCVSYTGPRDAKRSISFYVQLITLLRESRLQSDVQLRNISTDQTVCLLPFDPDEDMVALKIVETHSDEFLALLQRATSTAFAELRQSLQLQNQLRATDSQLAAWSSRLGQGYAELKWLHGLASCAELDETDGDPLRLSDRILPQMKDLIRARSVVYVNAAEVYQPDRPAALWHTGSQTVPDVVCDALIRKADRKQGDLPCVLQFDRPAFATSDFAGVLSAIVKPITRDQQPVAWILAVNKDLQHLFENGSTELDVGADDCNFGHFESGLVEAAANAFAAHARNSSLLKEKELLVEGAIRSLVNAIDAKDSYTCGHSDRVAEYARMIAAAMHLDEEFCQQIYMTGLLHDVGKIGVPDNVLQKPGRLTCDEFDKIKEHPVIGHEILKHLCDFDYVLPGVLHHHESVDGSGYPAGLKGEEIPLMARILAVADAYDAMTSDRPYRDGMSSEKAASIIFDGAGQQWDVDCVEAFRSQFEALQSIGAEADAEPVAS